LVVTSNFSATDIGLLQKAGALNCSTNPWSNQPPTFSLRKSILSYADLFLSSEYSLGLVWKLGLYPAVKISLTHRDA
jgi:hypothetical protein